MKRHFILAVLIAACSSLPALAEDAHKEHGAAPGSADIGEVADGEVRRVDKDARKLTIRHGPLPVLGMPTAMTMVYQVRDHAILDQVKAGDKIRFTAEKLDGQFAVIRIERTH